MSPAEKQQADALMSRGLSAFMAGDDKEATKRLLTTMAMRYQQACDRLKSLPQLAPTASLHHFYYNYFVNASQLFADYLRLQDNLFMTDPTTGQPLATGLIQRKQTLVMLESQCKQADGEIRAQYGVPPYRW